MTGALRASQTERTLIAMFHHQTPLQRAADTYQQLLASLTSALIARNYEMASLDLTKLNANSAEIQRIAAAAASGDGATAAAAAAAQLAQDQADLDAAVSTQATDIAPLSTEFPTPPAPEPVLAADPTAQA